jgi:hypothetical protein
MDTIIPYHTRWRVDVFVGTPGEADLAAANYWTDSLHDDR